MRREAFRHDGFTLLEVLAAVAVLGLVYTLLGTAATEGLRAEGDARRRLEASLLADRLVTEIEAQVAMGQAPEIGVTENEEGDFLVSIEVKPLDLAIGETKASKRASERLARAVGAAKPTEEVGSLLVPSGPTKQALLRRADVTVTWADGTTDRSVRRATYALDTVAAAPLIEQLVAAAEKAKAQAKQDAAARETSNAAQEGQAAGNLPTADAPPTEGAQRLRGVPQEIPSEVQQ